MVVSAMVNQRLLATQGANVAARRFQRLRVFGISVYTMILGFLLPLSLLCLPNNYPVLAFAVINAALIVGLGIAALTPLEAPGFRQDEHSMMLRNRPEAAHLQSQAREEVYSPVEWKFVRRLWLCYTSSALLSALLAVESDVVACAGLAAPIVAACWGVVIVKRTIAPGLLNRSLCIQCVWISALWFAISCATLGRDLANRPWAGELGALVGIPWSSATLILAPRFFWQLLPRTEHTAMGNWAPQVIGAAHMAGGGWFQTASRRWRFRCRLLAGLSPRPPPGNIAAWQQRRHAQVSLAIVATRISVVWVLAPLLLEVAMRRDPPALLLCLPPMVMSLFATYCLWKLR